MVAATLPICAMKHYTSDQHIIFKHKICHITIKTLIFIFGSFLEQNPSKFVPFFNIDDGIFYFPWLFLLLPKVDNKLSNTNQMMAQKHRDNPR